MQIYYAVTAEDFREAVGKGRKFAHIAYRIGADSSLLRRTPPLQTHGDLMSVSDADAPAVDDPDALCGAVVRECLRRGYRGAVLDFEGVPRDDLQAFARALGPRLRGNRRVLYVAPSCADADPDAVSLVCTAISGGNFAERLREEIGRRGGAERVALDVQRLRMDFRLPAPTGEGVPLTAAEFETLRGDRTTYFSADLCARYFTCALDGQAHFVLFDDADTIKRKLAVGETLGIGTAFLQWPEIRDIADALIS